MKKLILAALFVLPMAANAGFVEECKTANFNSDPFVMMLKASQTKIPANAKDVYSPTCKCYNEHLSSAKFSSEQAKDYTQSAFLFYIRRANMGRAMFVNGIDPRVQVFIEDAYQDCEQKRAEEFQK